jgi:hypothetical protein
LNHHSHSIENQNQGRERRLKLLIRRLPVGVQSKVNWLRKPSARWIRIPTGIALILGSFLFILPVFGLWMLPAGLILLAEDVAPLNRLTGRWLHWIEHRRPHWIGLPPGANASLSRSDRKTT